MNLKDRLWIIKSHIFEKRNSILMIVFFFLMLAILIILAFHNFMGYLTHYEDLKPRNRDLRIYEKLSENQIEQIKKINHVVFVSNLNDNLYFEIPEYNTNELGIIYLNPLLEKNEITIKNGKSLTEKYDMICPTKFYPHETFNENDFIKNIIGREVTINGNTFKIVGTYKNTEVGNSLSDCYISEEAFTELPNSQIDYLRIRVDNTKNNQYVASELNKLGIKVSNPKYPNAYEGFEYISLFITLLILFISFYIIYNFIKKKIRYRLTTYSILKVSGYKNKEIYKIDLLENIILATICFILSTICFIIIYNLVIYNINSLTEGMVTGEANLDINYWHILLGYIFIILMIWIATKYLIKLNLNQSINNTIRNK
ncbi:putative uncharacterized protein [Mycoplasma sp. CAG:776]|nr:putative uncharacterized protein [Mycoplasma sp. CAG:776]